MPLHLDHDALAHTHAETLAAPRRRYSLAARWLFFGLDATTHVHEQRDLARRIYDRILEARTQQDNEQWHLFILDELTAAKGNPLGRLRTTWLPQLIAFFYYQLSSLLYVVSPTWSYRLNADFEDHAEHEYAALVAEHPEWETAPFSSQFATDYGNFASLADLFRQISHDERVHKLESETKIAAARFN